MNFIEFVKLKGICKTAAGVSVDSEGNLMEEVTETHNDEIAS